MTCSIMETLRLWTSIPNGTNRELQHDEYILGKNDKKIKVKKGTYVQIPNWTRHRNPLLWGR
jgi:cytochrome P450